MIPYLKDKVYGYADLAGNIRIIPQFRVVNFFQGQSALVEIKKNDTVKNVIINKKGEIIFHNPGDKTLKLLPCGKYFTISESVKSKDHVLEKETLYTAKGELLQSFDGREINITCVVDSVVFYLFNKGTDETGPYQYNTFDLTGKRQIPQGNALKEFVFLNDSMLLSPQKQDYKLLRLHKHTFEYDQKFKTFLITAHKNLGNFFVFKNNKNQYGIANREGQIVVSPSFKRIINEDFVQTFSIKRSPSQEGYYSRFICLGFKGNTTQEYRVSGKQLLKDIKEVSSGKSCFELKYSSYKSAYMLKFVQGISTDTIFESVKEYKDSTNTFILGELKQHNWKDEVQYRLMDTTGKILIDDFNGSYCNQGIYLMKGKNAYSAFWRGGKFISPFIYSDYIYRNDSYVEPPPINKVLGNCIITVVLNHGNNAFGLIDITGKAILSPIYHYILPLGDDLFFVSGNNGMFYCHASGIVYADGMMGQ